MSGLLLSRFRAGTRDDANIFMSDHLLGRVILHDDNAASFPMEGKTATARLTLLPCLPPTPMPRGAEREQEYRRP